MRRSSHGSSERQNISVGNSLRRIDRRHFGDDMRINWRKWSALLSIYSGSLALLFQFQNCAPPSATTSSSAAPTSEVRVVDDWAAKKVSLTNSVLTAIPSATSVQVDGLCDRHMDASMPLTWDVRAPGDANLILAGTVDCELGGFRVMLSDLRDLACGRTYSFEIRTVDGESAQAVLSRNCSP